MPGDQRWLYVAAVEALIGNVNVSLFAGQGLTALFWRATGIL